MIQVIQNNGTATSLVPVLVLNGDGTIPGGGGVVGPDVMLKSIYDIDTDSKVDNVEKIAIEMVAAANITQYQVVTTDGVVADSDNLGHLHKIAGVALSNANVGENLLVQTFGEITDIGWSWTLGNLFLNGTSLSLAAPTSGFLVNIGVVKNANCILVTIQDSIKL